MMNWFLRLVIGGATGKRESAWFAFLLWIAATIWIGWAMWTTDTAAEGGPDLEGIKSMWSLVTPLVWTWLGAAHGFEWVSKQTGWGATQISYDTLAVQADRDPYVMDAVHRVSASAPVHRTYPVDRGEEV